MGAGASAVQSEVEKSSPEDIQQVYQQLSEADKLRVAAAVGAAPAAAAEAPVSPGGGGFAAALQGALGVGDEESEEEEAAEQRSDPQGEAKKLLCHAAQDGSLACALNGVSAAKGAEASAAKCPFADIIKATAGAVAPNVPAIIDDFYTRLFDQAPETKAFFNPANQFGQPPKQRNALANAVVAYASNIEDLTPLLGPVEIIANKHAALTVAPVHYEIVHKHLMASIGHILGDVVTPEIGTGWSDAVLALAKLLIEKEEELYRIAEARTGGWRGVKDFKLKEKRQVADQCVELTFEAADGAGPIDFTPGQFLTLHLKKEGATPRHYTVTSKPGQPFLQCCVKKISGGFVSSAVHDMPEGELVGLSAPFGTFSLKEKPIVLVSAGIGITPMKAFVQVASDRVKLAVHVDKAAEQHPFKDAFAEVPTHVHYTQAAGRSEANALVKEVLQAHVSECDFYLCGPDAWQTDLKAALEQAGAKGIYAERFGQVLA